MAGCTDTAALWRLLNSVWSTTGDPKTCSSSLEQLQGWAPAYDSGCFTSSDGQTSCTTAPNATSQRLCCCASDCDFDAGYCAEGYSPNTQTAAPTGGSETNEDEMQMLAMIAGFGIGFVCVIGCGAAFCLGRHLTYSRMKKKAINRLEKAKNAHDWGESHEDKDSEASEEMEVGAKATVPSDVAQEPSEEVGNEDRV